jgi:hypothetical protein
VYALTDYAVNLTVGAPVSFMQAFVELEPKALAIPRKRFDDAVVANCDRGQLLQTPSKSGNITTASPRVPPRVPNI